MMDNDTREYGVCRYYEFHPKRFAMHQPRPVSQNDGSPFVDSGSVTSSHIPEASNKLWLGGFAVAGVSNYSRSTDYRYQA